MLSNTIFKKAFMALVITGVLNFIASKFYLYWSIWWIDMVVHFFGGLTVALTFIWLYSKLKDLKIQKKYKIFLISLLGSIFIGIIWELYELYFGITSLSDGIHYITDTSSDLMMDTIGGIVGYFYVLRLLTNE